MPMGIAPVTLAESINAPLSEIIEIIAGKREIDEGMAKKLGSYFNLASEFWINLQALYGRKLENLRVADACRLRRQKERRRDEESR